MAKPTSNPNRQSETIERPAEEVKELLRKIRALAQGGSPGEREAAARMLARRLERHGLTLENLESRETKTVWFEYRNKSERMVIVQIVARITGLRQIASYSSKKLKGCIGFDLPLAQAMDAREWVTHYLPIYRRMQVREARKLRQTLLDAFIQKNHLTPQVDGDAEPGEQGMTEEEIAAILAMMRRMGDVPAPVRRIEESGKRGE